MKNNYFYIISGLILLSSCISLKQVEYKRTENFSISNNNTATLLNFGIVFHNPNSFGCTITDLESAGTMSNQLLFNAGFNTKVRAKRKSDFTFPVTARLEKMNFGQLLGAGLNLLLNDEAIPMQVKGKLKMKKWFLTRTYEFNYTQRIDKAQIKKIF